MRLRRLSAVLGAILLAVAVPAAASAGPVLPGHGEDAVEYYWLDCPEGSASSGTISSIEIVGHSMYLQFTITPCTQPDDRTAMAVGFYYADKSADGAPLPMELQGTLNGVVKTGAHATCLLTSYTVRLDCYELVWTDGQAVVGQRLSADDPRVDEFALVDLWFEEDEGDPGCTLCT